MAPTTTQEAGGSGSRPRRRRRRRRTSVRHPNPTTPTVTTRSRAAQSEATPSSQRGKRKRGRAGKQQSRDRKRARAANESGEGEEDAATVSASPAAEQASSGASSAVSSPRRCPVLPRVVIANHLDGTEIYDTKIDSAIVNAYIEDQGKYFAKLERERKLLTLDQSIPRSCLASRALLPIRESATKMIHQAAEVVVGLSSYIDGKLLACCSGFLIKLDKEAKIATVLTSADLICTKCPSIHDESSMPEFAPHAKVDVRLLDDSIADGRLLNYHKHYNIAVFEVAVKEFPQLPCLSSEVKLSQEVFLLGRDESLNLIVNHGRVDYMGPGLFANNHYMYITCGVSKCGAGGPIVDFDGRFVGMASPTRRMAFIPVSIILRCLRMWEKFKCVPRLHLGLKFSAIKFLDPAHSERISRKFKIKDGLIVQKVSEGSSSEKVGIRIGDIIECFNGKQIATNVDLEDELLQMCEDHLDKGKDLGSSVDVIVGVFHIRKESHCTKRLSVKLSDDMEIIREATYNVSAREGIPAISTSSDDDDDESPGQDIPCRTSEVGDN